MVEAPGDPSDLLHRPAALARSFDRISEDYDARPGYPRRVFDLLVERCGLGTGSRVLEVGAGVGQATLPMLDLGAAVTVVDPGAALMRRLAERARGRDLEIIVAEFERASLPASSFDLVASATAFHWVDPTVGIARCAHALRPSGWLALWWTLWGNPDRPDPFHDALEPILRAKAPQLLTPEAQPRAYRRDLAARAAHIDANGAFGPVEQDVIDWDGVHDPVTLRRIFATFASWIVLPDALRAELLGDVERLAGDQFAGTVRRPYQTVTYLAQRRP